MIIRITVEHDHPMYGHFSEEQLVTEEYMTSHRDPERLLFDQYASAKARVMRNIKEVFARRFK